MKFIRFILPVLILLLFMPLFSLAQEPGPGGFDFTTLGVDVMMVGVIIGAVELIKRTFMANIAPIYAFVAVVVVSILVGVAKNWGAEIDIMIKYGFAYGTAAVFLYEGGKSSYRAVKKTVK